MAAVVLTPTIDRQEAEIVRVFAWRFHELVLAGATHEDAILMAGRPRIDLHEALDLLAAGCPSGTALRILE
jgi:hypothetical protein